jgi:hypothetical protein
MGYCICEYNAMFTVVLYLLLYAKRAQHQRHNEPSRAEASKEHTKGPRNFARPENEATDLDIFWFLGTTIVQACLREE